jgi:two-component system OmpR family sensor kinase
MSSNRRPERKRVRSLRARLLVGVIALLALVCAIIGLVTQFSLHSFLLRQLDNQLMAAAQPRHPGPPGGGNAPDRCDGLTLPNRPPFFGLPFGSIAGTVADGQVVAGRLTQAGCLQPVSTDEAADLGPAPQLGVPYSKHVGSLGDYRLIAEPVGDGTITVTGIPLSDVDSTLTGLAFVYSGVAVAALVAAAVAGAVIVRRELRPLRRVADTATRVSELELDKGDVALSVRVPDGDTDPGTEVGQVGAALNRMLGHVADALASRHASETRVRQFLADASHELRTPLAAIRGYAELTRRGGDEVPDSIAHAMRRIESESARMTTLVDDLLLLARLDSGRPLERAEVDLSRLVVDAVSDAHVAGPDHNWRLDLPGDPVTVIGDGQRLHQVLANLLTNARTHTPAGTTVTTGLHAEPDHVVLTVTDDGPGVPPALLPEVFERFARGDTSRSRGAGSTGLGLAIVAAVGHAHGGSVSVVSEPGRTMFTVTLPRVVL